MDNIKFNDFDDNDDDDDDDIEEYENKLKEIDNKTNFMNKDYNIENDNENVIEKNLKEESKSDELEKLKNDDNNNKGNIIYFKLKEFNMNNKNFNFEVCFENDKYLRETSLNDLKDYILNLKALKFTFLPPILRLEQNIFFKLTENEIKEKIQSILNYLSIRNDILNCPLSKTFFNFEMCGNFSKLTKYIKKNIFEINFQFNAKSSSGVINEEAVRKGFNLSDLYFENESGLLILGYSDNSILSVIGKFWSIIESEVLSKVVIYQRQFDTNDKAYFTQKIFKNFDVRISKISINKTVNKILIGFENGTVQLFNINYIENIRKTTSKLIAITEGIKFKYLNDRISSFVSLDEYTFISSYENKIMVIKFDLELQTSDPLISLNASAKKRMEGKGIIKELKINENLGKLFIISNSRIVLIYHYKINQEKSEVAISFYFMINYEESIFCTYLCDNVLFSCFKNIIVYSNIEKGEVESYTKLIELTDKINFKNKSSNYLSIGYQNSIKCLLFLNKNNYIVLGLESGTLLILNSKTYEITYAKRLSTESIIKLDIIQEQNIIVVGDNLGTINFITIGSY